MPQRLTKSSIYSRSLGLSACASLESKNEVCLLCEVSPKANPSLQIHLCFFGEQSQPLKILGKGEGLPTWLLYNWDGEVIKWFSNLEIDHLNLQLKYLNLKERFGKNKSQPSQDTLEFDIVFEINRMKECLQGKDNTIRKLKWKISQINERHSEADRILDFKALDFQNIELTEKVTALQEQNELFRAENEKVKQHYKELYDSIKITLLSVKTLEIVEEARIEKPLDNALENACFYTKRSQELLEYVIGTCPKEFSKRDKKVATTPLNRNKQVAFRVNSLTEARGSKPRSNTKNNRILPAKSDNKKKWKPTGRKFTLEEQCPLTRFTQSKVVPLKQPEHASSSKIVITNRFSNNSHKQLTRYKRKNKQEKAISNGIPTIAESQSIADSMQFTNVSVTNRPPTENWDPSYQLLFSFVFNGHVVSLSLVFGFRALLKNHIDGESFKVNFVIQIFEVAFKKHSCYVRDVDGVELLKGSHGSNLYTISVEEMMKSSPICLLSKASKNKSWLWHRRLNHLNFGTINDLARRDLVRGYKVKFEKGLLWLVPNPVHAVPYVPPTNKDLEILFQPMFDEYLEPLSVERPIPLALIVPVPVVSAGTPSSTTIDQDAPSLSHSPSSLEVQPPISHQGVTAGPLLKTIICSRT
ncbi:integrase, catalytic region, zinc finger, CCHC-type containing protein [Tanacetum coccineum]